MVALERRGVQGAILLAILITTAVGVLTGLAPFHGVVSMPPSLTPTFARLDIAGALDIGVVTIVFAFLFVDLFDTAGTLVGVTHRAGLMGKDGNIPNDNRAFVADSGATIAGAVLGTSTTTNTPACSRTTRGRTVERTSAGCPQRADRCSPPLVCLGPPQTAVRGNSGGSRGMSLEKTPVLMPSGPRTTEFPGVSSFATGQRADRT